ncbi:MAG: RidA family protein [Adhaeribacter sp.]
MSKIKTLLLGLCTAGLALAFQPRLTQAQAKPAGKGGIQEISPAAATGSSLAVVVDEVPLAHTTQLLPLDKSGKLVGAGQVAKQVNQVLANLSAALKAAGTGTDKLVKLHVYLARPELMAPVEQELGKRFRKQVKPAVSYVVGELAQAGALVAMDGIAAAPPAPANKQVKYFRSPVLAAAYPGAHVAVLPAGGVVYVSGQADKGGLVEATKGTLGQLSATLQHLGLQKQDVVQIKAFTRPKTDIGQVHRELAAFFDGSTLPPVVYVDWLSQAPVIEIELIAASPAAPAPESGQMEFLTPPFMTPSPVYSKVSRINYGRKVYVSGLYGQGQQNAQAELEALFASLARILEQAGSDFRHLAKATYYVSNDQTSAKLNEIRPRFYDPKRPPAASKAMVRGVGLPGTGISLDMIGVVVQQK